VSWSRVLDPGAIVVESIPLIAENHMAEFFDPSSWWTCLPGSRKTALTPGPGH